jgi:adenine-specific DNA-methyltransferase
MPEINFKSFPTTRYQGSKRKILPWIHENLKELEFNTVLDACGGTGSVSYLFKKMGKAVTYNDKLRFNYLIGKALIENQEVKFLPEDYQNLFDWSFTNEPSDFIRQTFDRIYYPRRENVWLDCINNGIVNMNHYHGQELDYKKSIAYYALFQACLIKRPYNLFHRKNLAMRNRDVVRNFGNKKTWEKSFEKHFKKFIDEANSIVFRSEAQCTAINESIFDVQGDYDLVYIDPPYVRPASEKNETSNYLSCYHFLEGLANFERWPELIDHETANKKFLAEHDENDFRRANIIQTFEHIIEKFQDSIIVLSYKKGGVPSIETLIRIMRRYKNQVYTRSLEYVYALNRQNGSCNKEVLIIGI